MKKTGLFGLAAWSLFGFALLCGLGVWQLVRLQEKTAYLAALDARLVAPPTTLTQAMQRLEAGDDIEFLKIEAEGTYTGEPLYKQATFEGGPGWLALSPFRSKEGVVVLVDRGTVPASMRGDASLAAGTDARITGVVRMHARGQGFFDPENDPASNNWYWWDVPAMLGTLSISQADEVAPFVLQALPQAGAPRLPVAENLNAVIPNNHLQYALTWFTLALCLAIVAGLLFRRELRRSLD